MFSNTLTRLISLVNEPKRSDMDFINGAGGGDTGGGSPCKDCRSSNRHGAASPPSI